ncbi:hypothetical protein [Paenibacillus sp. YN15]|uniref:hypothetical protein n=1 Tax=Paenibacillus sp. YN15 TaxID=1742774 RepID=UPI000DCEBFC9|nr:hypothetical protein [Paenibacillus sp. YN15]RAV05113.1 hypothetical protein DQG13_04350 [Paenibacillus sp. YN15]
MALTVLLGSLLAVWSLASSALADSTGEVLAGQAPPQDVQIMAAGYAPGDSSRQAPEGEEAGMTAVIRSWLDTLSDEPGFEGWAAATWTVYPLGPGTHSWVVLLQADSREVGYLVLTADGDGYRLQEYGQGDYPLFSMNTLHRTLAQRGLISESIPSYTVTRLYAAPLQGVWRVEVAAEEPLYLDAKTGEELPVLDSWVTEQPTGDSAPPSAESPAAQPGTLSGVLIKRAFDPLLKPVWIKGNPQPAVDFASWRTGPVAAEETPVTYLGKWFGGKALYPLAVTGYHEWSRAGPFIRLEHEGSRFVPYAEAVKLGSFFTP